MAKIFDYIIIRELITEFYMELHDISYKEASLKLYANSLPTVHHIDTLMCIALYANSLPTVHHIDTLMCIALYANSLPTVHHIDTLMCTALYANSLPTTPY